MAGVRVKDISISDSNPVVGQSVTVTVVANNRNIYNYLSPDDITCRTDGSFGTQDSIAGHKASISLDILKDGYMVKSHGPIDFCAPIDNTGFDDPHIPFDVVFNSSGEYNIVVTITDNISGGHTFDGNISLDVVEDAPSGGGDGGGSNDDSSFCIIPPCGSDDGDDNGGDKTLLKTAIENPLGAGIVVVGGSIAIREAIGGDE